MPTRRSAARPARRSARRSARENPTIGKHPDLYERAGMTLALETEVVVDWKACSPAELRKAVSAGHIAGDELEEMIDEMTDWFNRADADGDVDALVAEGMSKPLAKAVAGVDVEEDLGDELRDLAEEGIEERIKPFVEYFRSWAVSDVEYETVAGNDGHNQYVDRFQTDLEEMDIDGLMIVADGVTEIDLNLYDAHDLEILRDPSNYDVLVSEYRDAQGSVWSERIGEIYQQHDGWRYGNGDLEAVVCGGEFENNGVVIKYRRLTQKELELALEELEADDPFIYFSGIRVHGKVVTHDTFKESFDYTIRKHDDNYMVAVINKNRLEAALGEESEPGVGDVPDDVETSPPVIYTFSGTNATTAGASAKGMYVVDLRWEPLKKFALHERDRGGGLTVIKTDNVRYVRTSIDLLKESAALGHCIGTPEHGHPNMLRQGETKVYSIRTEAGKQKFTIEEKKKGLPFDASTNAPYLRGRRDIYISEIKGKANRLPGFEPGKSELVKPDEVRAVVEFLQALEYEDGQIASIRDLAGAILAMQEAGIDPFTPPKVKRRPPTPNPRSRSTQDGPGIPLSRKAARLVADAYNRPLGGVWGVK